jgi:hypothetical protein
MGLTYNAEFFGGFGVQYRTTQNFLYVLRVTPHYIDKKTRGLSLVFLFYSFSANNHRLCR